MANYDPDLDPILKDINERLKAVEDRPQADLAPLLARLDALEARPAALDMDAIKAALRAWLDDAAPVPLDPPRQARGGFVRADRVDGGVGAKVDDAQAHRGAVMICREDTHP